MAISPSSGLVRFGVFEIDLDSGELRKQGVKIKLHDQPFKVLAMLLERPGQVVTREELSQRLWPADTFVDSELGLNSAVMKLRAALGDSAENPRFIETLPRRGYRLIIPVENMLNSQAESAAASYQPPTGQELSSFSPTEAAESTVWRRRRWMLGGAAAVVILAATLVWLNPGAWRQRLWAGGARPQIHSIAVLPLENFSHDPDQEYFSDGMTDELITALAKISALRVISRTSVMQYKGTKKPIAQIAGELNVDSVLEGTVTRDQQRFRITAQLISTAPERHIWAEQYEGNLGEALTIQDGVAKAIAHEIQIKLTPRERTLLETPRPVDPTAYEAYLRGRYLWELKGEENLVKSQRYFEEAIERDPSYALAWAGLADTYNYLSNWGVLPRRDAAPRAEAAAKKALELDSSLVGPLVALADVKVNYEWDWTGAERLCKQAIELNPKYGEAHHTYATYLAALGRTDEAIAEARRAREVEPLNMEYAQNVVWKLYLGRRYDEAELETRKLKEWWPQLKGRYFLAIIYLQTGRGGAAKSLLQQMDAEWNRAGMDALGLLYLGHALGVSGARPEARTVLDEMQRRSHQRYISPEYFAIVYEGLGERDLALHWFQKAYNEHSMNIWFLPDPALDSIRSDPRFKDIMRRMGLPK